MTRRTLAPLAAALLGALLPAGVRAQTAVVRPGMTRAQVEAVLGAPAGTRSAGLHTFLVYDDDCGPRCGSSDVVLLMSDTVIDALFRSPRRVYTGRATVAAVPARAARTARTTRAPARRAPRDTGAAAGAPPPAPASPRPERD